MFVVPKSGLKGVEGVSARQPIIHFATYPVSFPLIPAQVNNLNRPTASGDDPGSLASKVTHSRCMRRYPSKIREHLTQS